MYMRTQRALAVGMSEENNTKLLLTDMVRNEQAAKFYFLVKKKLQFTHTKNKMVCEYMYNRLQELRWEKDWSQTQLAMKSNVSHSTISLIENNPLENPHVYTAIKLANALGVSVEDIFKF